MQFPAEELLGQMRLLAGVGIIDTWDGEVKGGTSWYEDGGAPFVCSD